MVTTGCTVGQDGDPSVLSEEGVCVCERDLITSEWARPPENPLFAPCNPPPFWGRAWSQALESAPTL